MKRSVRDYIKKFEDDEDDEFGRRRRKPEPKRGLAHKVARGEEVTVAGRRFDGRYILTGAVIVTLSLAMAWLWLKDRTFYAEYRTNTVVIAGNAYNVTRFQGVDSEGKPDELRACFRIEGQVFAPPAEKPMPQAAPSWFKCFKPDYIARELAEGTSTAYLAEYDVPPGYDRIVTISSGGRAFMWRQPNGNQTN